MTRMMMMTTTGGAAEFPDGVGNKFEAPLERDKTEFCPSGVAASPSLGSGSPRGGGSQNANNGAGVSSQFQCGKNRRGIEGGEDGHTHARDFEQALYVAQIAPPMLQRGQR
jgi:hypothetical protein